MEPLSNCPWNMTQILDNVWTDVTNQETDWSWYLSVDGSLNYDVNNSYQPATAGMVLIPAISTQPETINNNILNP